ncbi:MAG: hypothetical protein KatS3mg085_622 [Candidatus Dojkabacteria bacterium]|nr:MAG: hypothetical protein KatS3mg085_622 [Candidatus Dojkabacteria bacterium]
MLEFEQSFKFYSKDIELISGDRLFSEINRFVNINLKIIKKILDVEENEISIRLWPHPWSAVTFKKQTFCIFLPKNLININPNKIFYFTSQEEILIFIVFMLAHELYHVRQVVKYPSFFDRNHLDISKNSFLRFYLNPTNFYKTFNGKIETSANLFAMKYIQQIQAKNLFGLSIPASKFLERKFILNFIILAINLVEF